MTAWNVAALDRAGLNLQAVLNLDDLPPAVLADIRTRFDPGQHFRQLILIGHAGKALWAAVKAAGMVSENPIDDFTIRTVEQWFGDQYPGHRQQIIYPGDDAVGLQTLGKLAGWHHASPLMLGISEEWGTWYAYRAVLLADTDLAPTQPLAGESPCGGCREKPCIACCPAGALAPGAFALEKCVGFRKQPSSPCQTTCLARVACPVGSGHRYCDEQIRHTYGISLKVIEGYD